MSGDVAEDEVSKQKQVHFRAPQHIVSRIDVLSDVLGKSRTDLIIEAMNALVDDQLADDTVSRLVATAYYEDAIQFEDLATLVSPREARGYRALKQNLDREPTEMPELDEIEEDPYPDDFDVETTTPK